MYFKDIIGQEEVKERLRQSTRTGIVPHAQLFTEQGGAGAFPLALAYARYLNCTNRTETDACGRCPSSRFAFRIPDRSQEREKERGLR